MARSLIIAAVTVLAIVISANASFARDCYGYCNEAARTARASERAASAAEAAAKSSGEQTTWTVFAVVFLGVCIVVAAVILSRSRQPQISTLKPSPAATPGESMASHIPKEDERSETRPSSEPDPKRISAIITYVKQAVREDADRKAKEGDRSTTK